jgi:hypothetical protein
MADEKPLPPIEEEPPAGSVIAIDWGQPHQEVWVSNRANVGNWYCPDVVMRPDRHPTWDYVRHRAEGRTAVLLTPADRDSYAAGFGAGVRRIGDAVTRVIDESRIHANGRYSDAG